MAKLFTPGPVMVPRDVLASSASQVVSHRGPEFREILRHVTEGLARIFDTDGYVYVLTGSGTTAVDAMAWSMVAPGEKVLVPVLGEFSKRLAESLKRRGARVATLKAEPGDAPGPDAILGELESGDYDALALVHNETSTGLAYRWLRDVARKASGMGVKVLVDTVSGLGGEEFSMRWGVWAAASCSHKALAAPPGASFVAVSREAAEYLEKRGTPEQTPPLLDLSKYHAFLRDRGETPFTPPVTILYALRRAIDRVLEAGVDSYVEAHAARASLLYGELPRLGLTPLVRDARLRSNTVAAFETGARSALAVKKLLGERGYVVATGMGELKDRVVRIGVMGDLTMEDVKGLIDAMREVLRQPASSRESLTR
ncbi:pyridoxal-phosphate-dependent aminotransferase family protein [Stetteria hydrogenophila]